MNLSFSEEELSTCMEELFPLEHSPPSGLDDDSDDVEILESLSLPTGPPPVDSEKFRDFARSRLNAECAFVAMTWANHQKSTVVAENGSQPSDALGLSQVPFRGSSYGVSMEQEKDVGGPPGLPSLQAMQKKPVADVKSMTCGNGLEAETGTRPRNMDLSEEKLRKRLTNREAARRSRYRKKAELRELIAKVSELKSKHASLLKNLSDIQQKHDGEAVEHELLKAELDYLGAQVKIKEAQRFFAAMPEISTKDMQLFAAMQDDQTQTLSQPFPGIQNGFHDKYAIPAAQYIDGAFEATDEWGIGTDHSVAKVSSDSIACETINSNAAYSYSDNITFVKSTGDKEMNDFISYYEEKFQYNKNRYDNFV